MSKKSTSLIRSKSHLSVVELHSVARDAEIAAATREAESLSRALALVEDAETAALSVGGTAKSDVVRLEVRAAAIAIVAAGSHLRAAITALEV